VNARDDAMARLLAARRMADSIVDMVDDVTDSFLSPDSDDSPQRRCDEIEDTVGVCHEVVIALQMAQAATQCMEPDEFTMSEGDLQVDEEDDDEEE